MTNNVGFASLQVIPSFDGFGKNLERGTTGPLTAAGAAGGEKFGAAAGKSAGSRFTSIFKTAARAGLIGLAGAGALAIKFGGDAVSAASDLAESTNKVQQVFGKSADTVLKFTESTADALGQTNSQAREAASTFGTFGSAAGLSDKKTATFAKRMTTLASDLASFNNTRPEDAVEALGAALRGESEPIRAYGVLLDEATLKAEAMRLGIVKPTKDKAKIFAYQVRITDLQKTYNDAVKENGKNSLEALKAEANLGTARSSLQKATEGTIAPLTQQQKLLAAQSEIFKQTEVAQGDFARTSDGLANQQRRLSARFEDAKAKLGAGLLPIMSKAADFLLDKGIPAFEDFSDWFNQDGIPGLKRLSDKVEPLANDLLPAAATGFEAIKNFAEGALPFAEGIVGAFNDMPGWVKKILIGGAVGGLAAKKLGLAKLVTGSGPGAGLFSKGSTPANPLNVFVVNNGLGGRNTPGIVPDGGGDPKSPRNRRTPTHLKGGAAQDLALLFGIPLAVDVAAEAFDWDKATEKERAGELRFLDKWGTNVVDAAHKARQGLADALNVDIADNIGKGPFFNGIPGTDFFINGDAKQQLSDALEGVSGPALLRLNDQLKDQFGVGIPRLVRLGMLDASAQLDFQLAKQQDAVIRSAREKVQGFKASIEGDYTGRFTLLGIDKANLQINGMFDLFMARNRRLQDQFPAGGEGSPQPPNHNPKGGGVTDRATIVNNTYNVNTIRDAQLAGEHRGRQISAGGFG